MPSSVFTDVAGGQRYAPTITWAAANGIVGSYGNGRFGPNDNIIREQLAAMLRRYAGMPVATNKELHFTNADQASNYGLEAPQWASEKVFRTATVTGSLIPDGWQPMRKYHRC